MSTFCTIKDYTTNLSSLIKKCRKNLVDISLFLLDEIIIKRKLLFCKTGNSHEFMDARYVRVYIHVCYRACKSRYVDRMLLGSNASRSWPRSSGTPCSIWRSMINTTRCWIGQIGQHRERTVETLFNSMEIIDIRFHLYNRCLLLFTPFYNRRNDDFV